MSLLKSPGAKNADGYYMFCRSKISSSCPAIWSASMPPRGMATAKRAPTSRFIQVDPFEREFSQSQQSGGGGGGGGGGSNNQTEISKREKELIAATWKQQNDKTATPKDAAAQGQFLSDAQQKLRDQVNALSVRMQSRDISASQRGVHRFRQGYAGGRRSHGALCRQAEGHAMEGCDSAGAKGAAGLASRGGDVPANRSRIRPAGGGGGGGGGSAGRDLASLFDLELDTEKNQYETAQTASPAEQHEKDVEDALAKLDALAKRQEELANQQHNPQQSFQERWQQEMLRREAEQLQRQMEQMARTASRVSNLPARMDRNRASRVPDSKVLPRQGSSSRQQAGSQSSGSSCGQSSDQRIEQALSRLNQATDAMKRGGNSSQQSAEAAREAADRLRDATNMMAGSQQQLASGKLDSLTHEAGRLSQQEHDQAERINKLASRQNDPAASDSSSGDSSSADGSKVDLQSMMARMHDRDQLAGERQQLSNDLSRLQKNLRDTARGMAPNQPGVAQKLRDALTEMDDSDLDNHVQRTADWLRSGINPNSNGTESEIAQGLSKLNQQLQQAQAAMGQGKPGQRGSSQGDQTAAINQLDRLRGQLEAMGRESGSNGQPEQNRDGQTGRGGQPNQNGRNQNGQNGRQPGQQSGTGGGASQNGQQSRMPGQNGQPRDWSTAQQPLSRSGQPGNGGAASANSGDRNTGGISGDTRNGGGRDGTAWNNFDTGNNTPQARGQRQPAPADAAGNPADTEHTFDQGLRELNQLRQMVRDDPQAAKDVADLTRQLQNLDPRRFPGNPAMVEHMHQEILSSVDKLELQLQRDGSGTDARTGKPSTIPAGYQDSVAEYYRKLSKNP